MGLETIRYFRLNFLKAENLFIHCQAWFTDAKK